VDLVERRLQAQINAVGRAQAAGAYCYVRCCSCQLHQPVPLVGEQRCELCGSAVLRQVASAADLLDVETLAEGGTEWRPGRWQRSRSGRWGVSPPGPGSAGGREGSSSEGDG